MTKGIIGLRSVEIHHQVGEAVTARAEFVAMPGYDFHHFINEKWDALFPGNVIVKCGHCGQWSARKTECKHCGAPVD
jgi:hypothetical protein